MDICKIHCCSEWLGWTDLVAHGGWQATLHTGSVPCLMPCLSFIGKLPLRHTLFGLSSAGPATKQFCCREQEMEGDVHKSRTELCRGSTQLTEKGILTKLGQFFPAGSHHGGSSWPLFFPKQTFPVKAASLTKKVTYYKGQAGTCDDSPRLFHCSMTRRTASGKAAYEKEAKSFSCLSRQGKVGGRFFPCVLGFSSVQLSPDTVQAALVCPWQTRLCETSYLFYMVS